MRCPFRSVLISALASGLGILFAFATGPTAQAQSPRDEKTSTQSAERGAQIQPGTSRPKIGVALEGGGALGLAHIGVLQWFEDHHIPIDYKCQQVSERCGNWVPGGDGYWAAVYWRKRGRHGACKMVF